ncbi:MAG: pitrilysin family protein [Pseudomonadota bacterium]
MRRFLAAVVATALSVFPAFANDQVTSFTLDNGMDVVVIEDNRAPLVVHMVWYRAGSADEVAGVSGIAHFLEHLMFKQTENLDTGEFSSTVAKNGGRDNAFTSYDYTAYFQRVASDRLELMMQMEADRMVNLVLDEDEVNTERDVVIEERNQRTENAPGSLFNEQMSASMFLNHRYGVPIIGWMHEIEELSLQDAQAFYDAHYAPNNAVLVVAGDVTPENVLALAEKHYGVIPANPEIAKRDRASEPPQLAARRLVLEDPRVGQPYVARSYIAAERDSGAQEKAAALTMLAEVLGGGTTAILDEKLQFDSQMAVFSRAYYRGGSLDDTTFDIYVAPAPGVTLEELEAAMDEVIEEFLVNGIPEGTLERIKTQVRASEIYGRDSISSLANKYGRALTTSLTVEDVQAWPDVLQAVTEEDVMAAAREVFNPKHSVTGYLKAPEVTQ